MARRKRAAAGAGTIRQRKDGKWEGRFTVGHDPATGKQVQKSIYGNTQADVRKRLQQICAEIDDGTYTEPSKMTVGEWLDIWHDDYLGSVKQHTEAHYEMHIRVHLKPCIGAVQLTALKPHTIQEMYNHWGQTMSPKSIKNLHGVLHRALKQALLLGYIRTNPADSCVLPRIEKKEIKPIDDGNIALLLDAIRGHKYEFVYKVDLFTGLRQGEILGLTWDNVDFDGGMITVAQQLQREHKKGGLYQLVSLKNDKTRRIRPAPFVMDTLKQQRQKQNRERMAAGKDWKHDWNLIFTNPQGGHLCAPSVYNCLKRIYKRIGIPDTRFHDLRHTYATLCFQNGDDVKTVQQNVGHATAAFTLDVYGHVSQRMQQESADRMQAYIKGIQNL